MAGDGVGECSTYIAQQKRVVIEFSFYIKGKMEVQRSKIAWLVKLKSAGSKPLRAGELTEALKAEDCCRKKKPASGGCARA